MAPKKPMSTAPAQTSSVPQSDHLVKGSPKIRVAHIELNTRPDACSVERTGSGSVDIWTVLPSRFDIMNMPIPSCHLLLRCGGLRISWGPFSSSRMCDLRCNVRPRLCTLVDKSPTTIPSYESRNSVSPIIQHLQSPPSPPIADFLRGNIPQCSRQGTCRQVTPLRRCSHAGRHLLDSSQRKEKSSAWLVKCE